MLPQQKGQVQVELKAACKALWGHQLPVSTASCPVLLHLRQQFWGLSIPAVLISDFYSQLAWLPLTANTTWETPGALTAPTKVSSIYQLVESSCQAPPGASCIATCIPTVQCPYYSLLLPSRNILKIYIIFRMGLVKRGALHTDHLWATHLHQKAQGGAHELASEVLAYGGVLVNNMNFLLVGTKQKTLFCLWPWHSWASLLLQCCLDNSTCLSLAAEDRSQAHDIADLQDENNGILVIAELLWHQSAWKLRSRCTFLSCLL